VLVVAAVLLVAAFGLTSPAFRQGERIPVEYTCDGANVSPALRWTAPPQGTKSFALIMDDPDAPGGTFTHWTAWNISPKARGLKQGARAPREGTTSFGRVGYRGPCPPAELRTATSSSSTRSAPRSRFRPAGDGPRSRRR
jgi:phosphatidylethanolamine-binding protein (PEBP) family uncharacterized protein